MHTAIVVNAKFIGNQTLQILEPVSMELNSIVKIIIEGLEPVRSKRTFGCAKEWMEIESSFYEPIEEMKEYSE